ncbi:hypothetical protein SCT_2459 [Sulfuricella sp. T08]|uniref:sulfotransferase family protein n=1 Tax=Sulfuricella sp. T08 TaxID=1632857 RepID=UPI000617A091|nr:sulfotransferase [Sulfuricella sp. T08]GAO37044.1 hypothetical protein SCT_2459 [Sulfuricella sp. T08]
MNLIQELAPKTGIVVLGMHRSGTSALAGVLHMLGIHPGYSLLPAMEGINPKGFWEHAEVVTIHDQILEAFDSSWYEETSLPDQWWRSPPVDVFRDRIVSVLRRDFSNSPLWLIKDPRMCRLLPLWQEVFRELACQPLFILMLRKPAEVAHSLRKRDNFSEVTSCLLWLTHMLEAEYQTRGQPRAFVNYECLLADWRKTVASIGQTLGLTWPVTVEDAAPSIEAFIDPSLRHYVDNATLPDHPVCRLAQEVFELLLAKSPDPAKLDRMRAQTVELVSIVAPLSKLLRSSETKNQDSCTNLARLESENALLHSEIKRVKNTASWQITKPLRLVQYLIRLIIPGTRKP